jgi:lantibiotic transport system ATP-binding protein
MGDMEPGEQKAGGERAPAVQVRGLGYRFGRNEPTLVDLDLTVPAGSIYGFLGPNGAGKTTTLRLILGLLRRQRGEIRVLGHTLDRHRTEVLSKVGSSIESPSIYGPLSARENLEVWRRIYDCDRTRIDQVLELVGLGTAGRKRADQFSLGMKQRLGIAVALLHEPELLILDEPANGLDPHGIIEIRRLLQGLNSRGTSILVSSHLLAEVEKLVTHLGIIDRGRIVFEGTPAELAARRPAGAPVDLEAAFLDLIGT